MYRIIVKREGESNKPYRVFEFPEHVDEVVEFIQEAKTQPGVFKIEIVGEFIWDEKQTNICNHFFEPVYRMMGDQGMDRIAFVAGLFQGAAIFL